MFEGQIERLALDSLFDWRTTESLVTQMVMKHRGVFKGKMVFLALDNDEEGKFADQVDYKLFGEVNRWGFARKIKYLYDNGFLPDSCYEVLKLAGKVRNTIHSDPIVKGFSQKDLDLFFYVSSIAYNICYWAMYDLPEDARTRLRKNAEDFSIRVIEGFACN